MVVFWLTAGALFLGSALALIFGFRQGRRVEAPAVQDLQVYRDQLAEIERDMARGVIAAEEAARLRTEVSRRILEADRAMQVVTSGEARGPGGAF
ncbi:MAG: c-type cytochrome biogenesis protein CcmI, partial [Gemmobacter sp.]